MRRNGSLANERGAPTKYGAQPDMPVMAQTILITMVSAHAIDTGR
jgi:hypothetical protein